ncbi:MAG: SAM-dependent methyltransferase [Pseudomonadota bacterium]
MTTPLGEILCRRIAQTGPMTIAEFMTECLLHPEHGYYTTRDPFGQGGDFTTAPEISQMFGELIGLALAQAWLDQGKPKQFVLAELGPGRGTLMADLLRASSRVPGLVEAAQVVLVEASPTLRARQRQVLPNGVAWVDRVEDLPDLPVFLVANEFFDALPIRQFVREGHGWRERVVTVVDGELQIALAQPAPMAALEHRLADTRSGDLIEQCAIGQAIIAELSLRLQAKGGCVLIIDYGDVRSLGDTLQAVRHHSPAPVLQDPGQADLTAHVDFEALAAVAQGAAHGPVPQGVWLERLGITERARALARRLSGDALESHIAAHRRLTHPEEMGTLFKALAVVPLGVLPPPGFEP